MLFTSALIARCIGTGRKQAHCSSQEGECGCRQSVLAKVNIVVGGRQVERKECDNIANEHIP